MRVPILALVALLVIAVPASAARWEYAGDACVDGARAKIVSNLGRDPFDGQAPTISVSVRRTEDGSVKAWLASAAGEREVTAASCEELAESIALIAVMILDTPVAPPARTGVQRRPPVEDFELQAPAAQVTPPLKSTVVVGTASNQRLEAGAVAGIWFDRGERRLAIELDANWIDRSHTLANPNGMPQEEVRALVAQYGVTVAPCVERGAWFGCGTVRGGVITASSNARIGTSPTASLGARAGRAWWPTSYLGVLVSLSGAVAITKHVYTFDDMSTWTNGRFEARLAVALAVRFP